MTNVHNKQERVSFAEGTRTTLFNRTTPMDRGRRSRRYRMRKYVDYRSTAYGGMQGQLVNVSEEGALLRCSTPITLLPEQEDAVVLNLSFPGGERVKAESIRMEVVPVWCSKAAQGDHYEVGLKWQHLSVPKKLMIRHWQRYCSDVV